MFVIDTDYDKDSEKIAVHINRLCERFKALGVKSLLFAYYDINENGPLYQNGNRYTVKDIVFVPNKTRKEIKFTQNMTVRKFEIF
jgi:tryptophan synthase alpha subunit